MEQNQCKPSANQHYTVFFNKPDQPCLNYRDLISMCLRVMPIKEATCWNNTRQIHRR